MFVTELTVAWFAQSTRLLADSLDMFAVIGTIIAIVVLLGARRILRLR